MPTEFLLEKCVEKIRIGKKNIKLDLKEEGVKV
jgi:hypothetical protein